MRWYHYIPFLSRIKYRIWDRRSRAALKSAYYRYYQPNKVYRYETEAHKI